MTLCSKHLKNQTFITLNPFYPDVCKVCFNDLINIKSGRVIDVGLDKCPRKKIEIKVNNFLLLMDDKDGYCKEHGWHKEFWIVRIKFGCYNVRCKFCRKVESALRSQ